MKKRKFLIVCVAICAAASAGHADAQGASAGVKVKAKADVKVKAPKVGLKAKAGAVKAKGAALDAKAARVKAKAGAAKRKGARLEVRAAGAKTKPSILNENARLKANANLRGRFPIARPNLNTELRARMHGAKAKMKAKSRGERVAKIRAKFKIPPAGARMSVYGPEYAKLSVEEKREVRAERRKERWAAWRTKHQSRVKAERPRDLPKPVRAEFRVNARRLAKLERIRFFAEKSGKTALVKKCDVVQEKEQARHHESIEKLLTMKAEAAPSEVTAGAKMEVKADIEAEANANAELKAEEK